MQLTQGYETEEEVEEKEEEEEEVLFKAGGGEGRFIQGWSVGMVLVAYTGPMCSAAALRDGVLCLPTDRERERERERDLLGNNVHDGGVQGAAR